MAGVEIPSAFASATIAAEARLLAVPAAERTEAQRVAAVTNSAADEANWQLHQIRIKRDALRAKGRVS